MLVVTRYRVAVREGAAFATQAHAAVDVLRTKPGYEGADLGRNVDDEELWVLATRWSDIGSYRRALGGYDAKATVVPLLSRALDEPSAYETDIDVT